MEQSWEPVEGGARVGGQPKEEDLRVEGRNRSMGTEALPCLARPAPWLGAVHLPRPASHSPGLSSAFALAENARPLTVKVFLPPITDLLSEPSLIVVHLPKDLPVGYWEWRNSCPLEEQALTCGAVLSPLCTHEG